MRPFLTFVILMVALALASCGGSDSKTSSVATSPGPTGSSGPGSAAEAPHPSAPRPNRRAAPAPSPGRGARFDRSSVRVSFLEKAFFGAKSRVVYFVAPRRPLAQAKACVEMYRSKAPSAYCFAFASERAFRFSGVSRRPPSKMQRACWSAYWGRPKGRRAFGSGTNPAAAGLRCPGAG
jgi:hypothetical protein